MLGRLPTLPILGITLILCACSSATESGQVELSLTWDKPPATTVWLWFQVEERPEPEVTGSILASIGPVEFSPEDQLSVELPQVPNGDNRVVVVEVREAANENLPVLYYGISKQFAVHPGKNVKVDTPVAMQIPETQEYSPEVSLQFGDSVLDTIGPGQLGNATVMTRSVAAHSLVMANDESFSTNLTTLSLSDPEGGTCKQEGDEQGITWDTCTIHPWDLSAGLPAVEDGLYSVYIKFVDRYGYESQVHKASVSLDSQPPEVLVASLSHQVAGPDDTVIVSATFHEPLGDAGPEGSLEVEPGGVLAFTGPTRVGNSNSYTWSTTITDLNENNAGDYTFFVTASDSLGNTSSKQPLADSDSLPLKLKLDGTSPQLSVESISTEEAIVFSIPGEEQGIASQLVFLFSLQDENLPLFGDSEEAPCVGDCPEVRLGGKILGTVFRKPAGDDHEDRMGFRYLYDVSVEDWGDVDVTVDISIRWADLAGNQTQAVLDQKIRFDFIRPEVLNCNLTPVLAGTSQTITYEVVTSEPLLDPPELQAQGGPEGFFLDISGPDDSGVKYIWTQDTAGLITMDYSLAVRLVDQSGNESRLVGEPWSCPKDGSIDGKPPELQLLDLTTPVQSWSEVSDGLLVGIVDELVTIDFAVTEDKQVASDFPSVVLDVPGEPMVFTKSGKDVDATGSGTYQFALALAPADLQGMEGAWPIRVTAMDAADNLTVDSAIGDLYLLVDFSSALASCTLVPPPGPGGYKIGDAFALQIAPYEALWEWPGQDPYIPQLLEEVTPDAGETILSYAPETSYSFQHLVEDGEGEYDITVKVQLKDRSGNVTLPGETACVGGIPTIVVDGTKPQVSNLEWVVPVPGWEEAPDRPVKADLPVQLSFAVANTSLPPMVHLGKGEMMPVAGQPEELGSNKFTWIYERILTGTEGEGWQSFTIDGADEAGNAYSSGLEDALNLDFTPPQGACFLAPQHAKAGDTISLSITTSEPQLNGLPSLESTLPFNGPQPDEEATQFDYTHQVQSGDEDVPEWNYKVLLTDVAGNTNSGENICSGTGSIDSTPPEIEGGGEGVWISSVYASSYLPVQVEFSLSNPDDLEGLPVVKIGPHIMEPDPDLAGPTDFGYIYLPKTEEPGADLPGIYPVTVSLTDQAGNQTYYSPGTVTFDFEPPKAVGPAQVVIASPSGCLLPQVEAIGPGGECRVTFTVTEPLGVIPEVKLVLLSGNEILLDEGKEHGSHEVTFVYKFKDPVASPLDANLEISAEIVATLSDPAGNFQPVSLGYVDIDTMPPPLPDVETDGAIVYTRIPWGAAKTDGAKQFHLSGLAGALEPGSHLVVSDHENLDKAAIIGQTKADDSGAFGESGTEGTVFALHPADRARVYVHALDSACNGSDADSNPANGLQPVLVRNGEWIATLGYKQPGSSLANPHDLLERPWFDSAPESDFDQEPGEPTHAAMPDETVLTTRSVPQWARLLLDFDAPGPFKRHLLTYNTTQESGILFGGDNSDGSVYQWDGYGWRKLTVLDPEGDGNPGGRLKLAYAYDSWRDRLVLFGGSHASGTLNDTWEFNGRSWALRQQADSDNPDLPPAMTYHAMAFDSVRGVSVLAVGDSSFDNDVDAFQTWEWDGTSWTLAHGGAEGAPSVRQLHAAVFDEAEGEILVFGGMGGSPLDDFNDLYAWDGMNWEERTSADGVGDGPPQKRRHHAMAYDSERKVTVLYGGDITYPHECHSQDGSAWEWDGNSWTEIIPQDPEGDGHPGTRVYHRMMYDSTREVVVLHGGEHCGNMWPDPLADTWEWNGISWKLRTGDPAGDGNPSPRQSPSLTSDSDRRRVILHSGVAPGGESLKETWEWDGDSWTRAEPEDPEADGNPVIATGGAVYDALRQVTLFRPSGNNGGKVWEWNGASWKKTVPAGLVPESNEFGPLAFDMLTGLTMQQSSVDTWFFDGAKWTRPAIPDPEGDGHPNPGKGAGFSQETGTLAFDEHRGVMVCKDENTWEWDGTSWLMVTPQENDGYDIQPTPGQSPSMIYDTVRKSLVLYQGRDSVTGEVWEYDGTGWLRHQPLALHGDGVPAAIDYTHLAFDYSTGNAMLVAGKGYIDKVYNPYTWHLRWGEKTNSGHLFRAAFANAEVESDDCTGISVRWRGGATGYKQDGSLLHGARLMVWSANAWTEVDQNDGSVSAVGELEWATSSPEEIQDMFLMDKLLFAIRPEALNGHRHTTIATDYVEVQVDYRLD